MNNNQFNFHENLTSLVDDPISDKPEHNKQIIILNLFYTWIFTLKWPIPADYNVSPGSKIWTEETKTTLEDLNDLFTKRNLGGIMIVGCIGNFLVIWIYSRKFKATNFRTYTLWLASMDVTNCCIGMPFLLLYHTHYLTFPSIAVYNGFYCEYFFLYSCRHRIRTGIYHVCRPCNIRISKIQRRLLIATAVFLSLGISWPALVLFGNHSVKTLPYNIIVDKIAHTKKTTLILLAVTAAYVLSALPHNIFLVILFKIPLFHCNMTFAEGLVFYIFVWSILINNSVNPFIYGFSDREFRKELKKTFKVCFARVVDEEEKSSKEYAMSSSSNWT
ncbi:hypothetical protein KUTeg_002552 [Tegillarca granosa]|uniref:G-protein coupled receptors family 1 profile domain-containing protein n=1 Tax=Tegillarca granosa TaxID=220873 RepID=A0ABQ9FXH7_TEGGR|nr:hypothetical protein KUTeg_002552 [Tegillarca granosa]